MAAGVKEDLAVVPEGVLRRLAKKTVLPDYPEASKKRGTAGRAVAQLDVDKEGRITGASGVVAAAAICSATLKSRCSSPSTPGLFSLPCFAALQSGAAASLAAAYENVTELDGYGTILIVLCGGATATVEQIKDWSKSYV